MGRDPSRGLESALRGAGVPEVDTSTRRRAEYSSDASLYRVVPAAVVFPRSTAQMATTLRVCRELGVPLVVRGAGTSVAGNAVGTGVVMDTSRHLRRIWSVDPDSCTAVVEPGVVLDDLQRAAAPYGLRFGPDPSTHGRATIGGMLGNNACGSRALRYGRTSGNVLELDTVTGTGERLHATRGTDPAASGPLTALHAVVARNLAVIRTELGRFGRQVSGYSLEHLLPENGFDVAKALVGTEGSCALTLQATLRLVPLPAATTLVVLGYRDLATAADAVPSLLPSEPVALEGIDARIVDIVRRTRGAGAVPPLPAGAGWLFVELAVDAATSTADGDLAAATAALVSASGATDWRQVTDPVEARSLWRIREDGSGLVARPNGERMALAGWEDAAVPPVRLGSYLREFESLVAEHGLTGLPYGHFGDGCVHVRLDFPLMAADGPEGRARFRRFLLDAAALVAAHGGSMSGEHGDGRARSELLPLMYSPAALQAFSDVKAVFDPDGILNPGIVVRPRPVVADLRLTDARPLRTGLAFDYPEDSGDFSRAVHRCTGVGACRSDLTAYGGVMCPSFLATRDEKDSTRGRARVLQEMANGSLVQGWRAPEVREVLDLCLSCKGCSVDCPTGTDLATYKAEVLHQAYRRRLRPASHYALGRLPTWARLAGRAPGLMNRTMSSPLGALGKRLAGIDGRRQLPQFSTATFRHWFARQPLPPGTPVLLWVDTFTDHFTPEVGVAAVDVLTRAGFSTRVMRGPLCCGLTLITTGQLGAARRVLRRSVDALLPAVRAGVPVVGLEPSCIAAFRGDAARLLPGDAGAGPVGGAVRTLAELLTERAGWAPPDLAGMRVLSQPHCHHQAVMGWATDEALLTLAGATVRRVGGCCGLAGNFGAERGHYDVSVAIAQTALLPAVRTMSDDEVLLADGFSCRTQLAQLGHPGGIHLAELLAGRP